MKNTYSILVILTIMSVFVHAQNVPYPHHTSYKSHIKPDVEQTVLDKNTSDFYNKWKQEYLVSGCNSGEYYVDYDNGQTVSEAHGYGMMISVIMAGFDSNAKIYFDGMFNYFKNHPSGINSDLMAWKQTKGCVDVDGADSATDGDIDIAFALLLADKQWGSGGSINYLAEAKTLVKAIMKSEINNTEYNITYGDWVDKNDNTYYNATRSSDFITDHFRSFQNISYGTRWTSVVDKCYSIIDAIQTNYSPQTGLIPDFMVSTNKKVKPAPKSHLEGPNDGSYYYNACRFPWRIGTDFLINGDDRAKLALDKLNTWIISKTNNNPSKIKDGYKLDGTPIATWSDGAFVAPFAVSAMINSDNQDWLNKIYNQLLSYRFSDQGYYENTIQLLSYIVISGNYWTPETIALSNDGDEFKGIGFYPNPCKTGELRFDSSVLIESIDKILAVSMSGKSVKLYFDKNSINLSKLSEGTYVIKVFTTSDKSFSRTIFVK